MEQTNIFNLEHTKKIYDLCQIEREQRQDDWVNTFFKFIPTASMASAEPQIITGPDKFPYFVLDLPTPSVSFESFSLLHILDYLTLNGFGLVINPLAKDQPDWIFSYGDIWNFKETGTFIFENARWENKVVDELVANEKEREVLIASPSNHYLPEYVRKNLTYTLSEKFKIKDPAIFLMTDFALNPSMNLVFNIFIEEIEPAIIQDITNYIAWSLPRDYGLVAIEKNSELAANFQPLYLEK